MARLQVIDRFRSIYAKDGWIFSHSFASLRPWWGHKSSPCPHLPVLLPAWPFPCRLSGKAHHALRVEDTERTKCGSRGGNPSAAQDVTARTRAICQTLPFIGGIPYIFQVDFLNMTIHECYTDTPETAFSRQISDFCLLLDLGTLRCQVAALLPGVSPP